MIDDVADMDKRVRARIRRSYPPMTGVVRVKSKVTHFGDPTVANPFPFVFHIVLVDKNSAVEVAFFGSMCAQYFDVIQEGDLIQLRGYSVSVDVAGDASNPSDLFFFEHESPGEVFHVPTKHWMLLETTGLLKKPVFLGSSDKAEMASRGGVNSQSSSTDDPLWLECNFATTLNMQHWSDEIMEERESFYFDFVGVLSFVGRVEIPLFRYPSGSRWLKAVDSTSSTELIILLEDCMQAKLFRSLQAGDTIMFTKLQLDAALPSTEGSTKQQPSNGALYARSSTFTVLRANEEVRAFNGIEECRLNSLFADSLVSKVQVKRKPSTGESWLEDESMTQYQTRLAMPADPKTFASVHDLRVVPVSNVSMYTKDLVTKTFTTVRIGVVGHLVSLAIDTNEDDDENGPSRIEIEIGDDNQTMKNNNKPSLKATLSASPIFDVLKKPNETMLKHITPAASKRILETLAPSLVDEILAMTPIKKATLSVPVAHIEQQLVKPNRVFLFSTRLYRTAQGSLQIDVEAIVPYTP
uniref:Uncharacterized protein n=1 Tax=Globisporangium ultimum (strain ATCC 200006 / CBS 805.95 / DAOM BR144) TaxID=431595 RepID=K3X6Z8_GLOUD